MSFLISVSSLCTGQSLKSVTEKKPRKAGGCEDDRPTGWLRARLRVTRGGAHRFGLAVAFMQLQAALALPLLLHDRVEGLSSRHTVLQAPKLVPFPSGDARKPASGHPPTPPSGAAALAQTPKFTRVVSQAFQCVPRALPSL